MSLVHPAQTSVVDPDPAVVNEEVDKKVSILQLVKFVFERSLLLDCVVRRGRGFQEWSSAYKRPNRQDTSVYSRSFSSRRP